MTHYIFTVSDKCLVSAYCVLMVALTMTCLGIMKAMEKEGELDRLFVPLFMCLFGFFLLFVGSVGFTLHIFFGA
jgi:hypothetical protein